ncbi:MULTISPECIES: hypothetical protein [Streptomyces]|uniref:Uncharacterized protein n=1 Tax=Streptomyces griseiscabiei TaxID=2993540 RepID=A0ABU4LG76_9ACTN|nr:MULTISPECIES: hypothetical protein [Streptomyces]MBZ3908500.1 hypothetical protein [Streptomyces griseiscabiei]MDX2914018.1 hypothetical protein [Streptomyces griseiscabiei]
MIHLPLAQDLDKEIHNPHEFHNRVRKALLTAEELRTSHFGGIITTREVSTLTHEHMALAARRINEKAPTVRPDGSPTGDLIVEILLALHSAQPSGRGRSVHQPAWVADFTQDLRQAIPIAFDAFWNKFDGRLTMDLIDSLTTRQMTAIARRIRPAGRTATQLGAHSERLVRDLLRVIHDAQPDASATAPSPVTATQLDQGQATEPSTLHEAVTAAIAAAAQSKTPTIVVFSLPQQ